MVILKRSYYIENIILQASADAMVKHLKKTDGIRKARFDMSSHILMVSFDPDRIGESDIIDIVSSLGHHAYPYDDFKLDVGEKNQKDDALPAISINPVPIIVSLILILLPGITPVPSVISALPLLVILYLLKDVYLQQFRSKMPILFSQAAASAIGAAFAIGSAIILWLRNDSNASFFCLSAACILLSGAGIASIVKKSRAKATKFWKEFQSSIPETAFVYKDYHESVSYVSNIQKNELILVRQGEKIPVDGPVIKGSATVDESILSGDDSLVLKKEGMDVYAGTELKTGSITINTKLTGDHTAMMKLVTMAKDTATETSLQSPYRIHGRYLLLYMMLAALIVFTGWMFTGSSIGFALGCALSVMACTSLSALNLCSDSAVVHTSANAVKSHILFKNVTSMDLTAKTDMIFIEQDGLITQTNFYITDFIPANGISRGKFEYIALALMNKNDKQIAKAITQYLRDHKNSHENTFEPARFTRLGNDPLHTLSSYEVNSLANAMEKGINITDHLEYAENLYKQGKRILVFSSENTYLGLIAADRDIIPESIEMINRFEAAGIEPIIIANGNENETINIKRAYANIEILQNPTQEELIDYQEETDYTTSGLITTNPESILLRTTDLSIVTGVGIGMDQTSGDIIIARESLYDYLEAINLARKLYNRVHQSQLEVLGYHAIVALLTGLIFPLLISQPFPAYISALIAYILTYIIYSQTH